MNSTIENKISSAISEFCSEPTKAALIKRSIDSLYEFIQRVSSEDAAKLLAHNDVDFSLSLGEVLAEGAMLRQMSTTSSKKKKFLSELNKHGGGLTTNELSEKLNIKKSALSNRKSRKQLFSVKIGGQVFYPRFQFNDHMEVQSNFFDIFKILDKKNEISAFFFFTKTMLDRDDEERFIYDILKGGKQPAYIYDQILQAAKAIHSSSE